MSYLTKSGLYQKFGTEFATPNAWGDYVSFGSNRVIEGTISLPSIAAGTTSIISDVTFFPALAAGQLYIEQVEAIAETAAAGGTSFDVGLIQLDRTTVPGGYGTAFIAAQTTAGMTPAGKKITYVNGTALAGSLIGSSAAVATGPYYLTAATVGTFTTGVIRVRIFYHAIGVITQ